jgi:hypothetical protein
MNSNGFYNSATGSENGSGESNSNRNNDPRLTRMHGNNHDSLYGQSAGPTGNQINFGDPQDDPRARMYAPTPQRPDASNATQVPASDTPIEGSGLWHGLYQTPYFSNNQNWSNYDPRVDGINPQHLHIDNMFDQQVGPSQMGASNVSGDNPTFFDQPFSHVPGQFQAPHAYGQQAMQPQADADCNGQTQYPEDQQIFPQTDTKNDDAEEVRSPVPTKGGKQDKGGKQKYKRKVKPTGNPRKSKGQPTTNTVKKGVKVYPRLPREAYLLRAPKVTVNTTTVNVTDDHGNDLISGISNKAYRKLDFLDDTLTYGQCTGDLLLRAELNGANLTGDIIPRIDPNTITGARGPVPSSRANTASTSASEPLKTEPQMQSESQILPSAEASGLPAGFEAPGLGANFLTPPAPSVNLFGPPAPGTDVYESLPREFFETPGLSSELETPALSSDVNTPDLFAGDGDEGEYQDDGDDGEYQDNGDDGEYQDEDAKGDTDYEYTAKEPKPKKKRSASRAAKKTERSLSERLNRCLSNKRQKYRYEHDLGFSPAANLLKTKKGKVAVTGEAERILGPLGGGRNKDGLGLTADQLILNTIGEINHKKRTFRIHFKDGGFNDFPVDPPREVPADEREVLRRTNQALLASLVSEEEFLRQHPEYVGYNPTLSAQSSATRQVPSKRAQQQQRQPQQRASQKRKRSEIEAEEKDEQALAAPEDRRQKKKPRGLQSGPVQTQVDILNPAPAQVLQQAKRPASALAPQQLSLPGLSAQSGFPITIEETYHQYAVPEFFEMESQIPRVVELGHGRLVATTGWLLEYYPHQSNGAANQPAGTSVGVGGFQVESGGSNAGTRQNVDPTQHGQKPNNNNHLPPQ